MPARYRCPHCKAILNPGTKIVLRLTLGTKAGLVLLSPKVGDYTVILPEDLPMKEGDTATFQCPVCGTGLTSEVDDRFGEVLRERPDGRDEFVHFHRKFGEHATFVVSEKGVQAFGDDASRYDQVNFFGAGRDQE
ncbi:MAG: hypothetical protein MUC63_07140 [Planctomycetes bacterium]|jgi:hypothetical protein|nr:hypothetical protein [Planctomycetota bacterium]